MWDSIQVAVSILFIVCFAILAFGFGVLWGEASCDMAWEETLQKRLLDPESLPSLKEQKDTILGVRRGKG